MRKNKGFTLIELLAVIIVLAIIALISIPLVLNSVAKAEKEAYRESLRNVLSATEVYVASEDFIEIPDEGLDVSDARINMKNKNFTTGKVFINSQGELELEKVGNEKYCGGGTLTNLIVIESSCENLDVTKPSLSIATNSVTSSSITVVATAEDLESDISGYQFSKDNGDTWTSKQISNVYTFDSLTNDTTYQIKVKVHNDNPSLVLSTTKLLEETTENIPLPIYSVDTTDWSQSKVVTITYPERKTGYVYEYSLDGATTWEEVASPATTKDITFNSNGNVIARISDGTNIVSGTTYEVTKIDTVAPVITVNDAILTVVQGAVYTDEGITASDDTMGDISSNIVTTGTVDADTPGSYTLRYNVTDSAGNSALEVIRQVNVINSVYTFTNAGKTGRYGPSQAQIDTAYSGTSLAGNVTSSSGIQLWSVPVSGTYRIEAYGPGSVSVGGKQGNGARMRGDFELTAGTQLKILVGQKGISNSSYASGSGGTFVTKSDNTPLIVAGGGGGPDTRYSYSSSNATTSESGQRPSYCGSTNYSVGSTGYGGNGGGGAGAGGGFYGNGSYSPHSGIAFINGGTGGYYSSSAEGGFGGGGATSDDQGAAGGGYTGGSSCSDDGNGAGGSSYNSGTNQSNTSGANSGNGQVIITIIP